MKILLVEDAPSIAAIMSARLRSFGFEVINAENGQIAIEQFKTMAPDLILMDIEMPVMNGFEATTRIRSYETTMQWSWTPIIFLTASDTSESLVTAIEAGADDFLSKSVPESVLHAKMKAMSRIATLRQRLAIANQQLHEQANRDGLTNLFNRRYMDMHVDLTWDEAKRENFPFAVLMIDIDNFKKYNDHYGHQVGDDCLKKVAYSLGSVVDLANDRGQCRRVFVARYGGEEFAVVIADSSEAFIENLAVQMVDAVRAIVIPHKLNDEWGIVTVSIGGGRVTEARDSVAKVFRAADERLYQAKQHGRNRAELICEIPTKL
jgi:diguanylate cyclase (GGDEF)-like protein